MLRRVRAPDAPDADAADATRIARGMIFALPASVIFWLSLAYTLYAIR